LPLGGIADQAPRVEINGGLWFVDSDGYRVIYRGWQTPLYRVALDDEVQLRFVAVALRQAKLASQEEIARAFDHSIASQRRWERRYEADGLEGLRRKSAPGPEFKIAGTQEKFIRKWFAQGVSNGEMARRLGVTEGTVRNALKRLGLQREPGPQTPPLAFEPAAEEEPAEAVAEADRHVADAESPAEEARSSEADTPAASALAPGVYDPLDRSLDRLFARLGKLDDATPAFAETDHLPRLGIFLVVPLLVRSGVLSIFQELYHSIGPAFYGLRTTVVCLFLLALLRIKRAENLKEYDPQELGRLLGLDRAPEVKTLRRKLDTLAERGRGLELMNRLAQNRLHAEEDLIGVLYVDDHVQEYHGQEALAKAYITRRRLAAKATSDTWVNDIRGEPIFVVPNPMNASLTKTLLPALEKAREWVGPERQLTVVFDRGGWSTKLFYRMIRAGFHVITYRRGHDPKIAPREFTKGKLTANGQEYEYELHDQPRVRVGKIDATTADGGKNKKRQKNRKKRKKRRGPKYLWMRQVTRRRDGNHQTPVITSRMDLAAAQVLFLMFNRWRQENFFKYMREEFALDGLVEYGVEPLPEEADRPNPQIAKLDKKLHQARAELKAAERALGEQARNNQESTRRTMRGFKIANARLFRKVARLEKKIAQLKARKAALPKRVAATDLNMVKPERRLIANTIKMTAYQLESDLYRMLSEDYPRCQDDGRTLLHAAFQSGGKLEVRAGELRVTLTPQSSPHRTRAVEALCRQLNELDATFPGTALRIVLSVAEPLKTA